MTYFRPGRVPGQGPVRYWLAKVRRVIRGRVAQGETVIVFLDAVTDPKYLQEIQRDWPPDKVRFSRPHPELGGKTVPKHYPGRRKL